MAAIGKREAERILKQAEKDVSDVCDTIQVGAGCRAQCVMGGMAALQVLAKELARNGNGGSGTMPLRLGIIVSPFEDCQKGFEEIIVQTPKNKKVKLCRLGPDVRKKWAPAGKPYRRGASGSPLRRKKEYRRGVTTRPITKD